MVNTDIGIDHFLADTDIGIAHFLADTENWMVNLPLYAAGLLPAAL